MANGQTIHEIQKLLSEKGAIKTQTALRLSLELQAQIYQKQVEQDEKIRMLEEKINGVRTELQGQVDIVKGASIVLWVQRNPKFAAFLLTLYVVLAATVDVRTLLAKALGVH